VKSFSALIRRDLRLAVREGGAIGTALGFFLIVVSLMPLGLGPDLNLLARIAAGVLWIALLLAALLSLNRIFEADYEDGTLEVLATGPLPLEIVAAGKALAHWVTTGIPLAIAAPVVGILLNLDLNSYPVLIATTLLGTPAVSFLGAVGAALTMKTRRGGLLLALIVLPLYVPTLIFGISAVSAGAGPGGLGASFLILAAISLVTMVLGPVAAAAALRVQLQ
jgi:heme exporter protein B